VEFANQEDRLKSTLLDRLKGHSATPSFAKPDGTMKHAITNHVDVGVSRRQQIRRLQAMRREIERDVLLLLTTRNQSQTVDLTAWPQVQTSVVNYGIPDVSGLTNSSIELKTAAKQIQRAIEIFEPRFQHGSVQVQCRLHRPGQELVIDIQALFGPVDDLQTFAISSTICLGSGQVHRPLAA